MRVPRKATLGAWLAAVALVAGCGKADDPWKDRGGPPRVVVSFPPLDCFVRNVAGPRAGLICLCTTTGPHDYQYNLRDADLLRGANLFLANGLGLDESFVKPLHERVSNNHLVFCYVGDQLRPGM